jgi:hypothetical protein
VDAAIVAPRRADQERRAFSGLGRQLAHPLLHRVEEERLQHQILGRVAADRQFAGQQQVGAGRPRLVPGAAQLVDVAAHVAERRVQLGEGDDETIGHDEVHK